MGDSEEAGKYQVENRQPVQGQVIGDYATVYINPPLPAASVPPDLPELIWNIPYPRNPFFIGRDRELERLYTQLHQRQTAVVGQTQSISGLGGIGKTQLAVEYAYRHQNEYHYTLWARAESVEALNSSYSEIACLLDLPEKDAEVQEITMQAVKRWLQQQHGWLLILDNADSPALLLAFLPPTVGGHLLLTTRAADVSTHLSGFAHPLVVETFSDEQGALFLLHRSGLLSLDAPWNQAAPSAHALSMEIAHELGGLPLALDQAGAYLKATGCSLAVYQRIYRERRAHLLKERRSADHPEPIATTWNLSFENVEQQNPAAADLLCLCAFFAPDAIPEEIVTQGAEVLGPLLAPVAADAYLFNRVIETLQAYSLITRDPDTQTLTIHRLVQTVLQDSLSEAEYEAWTKRVLAALNKVFPDVEHATWGQCGRLLPHVLVCQDLIERCGMTTAEAGRLLNQTGYYLRGRARFGEAEPVIKRALAIAEQQLGASHPGIVQSLNNLAGLYRAQGKYAEAGSLYMRALLIRERELGASHPDTANSLNNLALLYFSQGKYAQAESLYMRALAIHEQEVEASHPNTVQSLNNLAFLYYTQGRYEEAESLYMRALMISEQQLGPEHPYTTSSLNSLAELYRRQGKYEQAEPLMKRALLIRERELGASHPDTANSLNNLALLYFSQGKYAQAESLYMRALAIREQVLGASHPDTANSLNNLAFLYYTQGRYEEAEPLYVRALMINEQELGPTSPAAATSFNNLAFLYCAQGKDGEAEPLLLHALEICERELGASHPLTASSLNSLATLYHAQGKYAQAEPLFEHALAIVEQVLGASHPDTAQSLNNLALLYFNQGKYEQAEPLYRRALHIYEHILGPEHPNTQVAQRRYTSLLRTMGRNKEVKKLEEES